MRSVDQVIPSNRYTLLTFPSVNIDEAGMAVTADEAIILPSRDGVGLLEFNVVWAAGNYTELRDVFSRDPRKVTSDPDNRTGYDHRAPSPGVQCFTKQHSLIVHPDIPLGVFVYHNSPTPVAVTMAQFKLTIF